MISKNASRIMEFLLRRPGDKYNVNQIARELKISVGSAHSILTELAGRGIVTATRMGNAIFHRLDLSNEEASKLCELILIEGRNKALAEKPAAGVYAKELQRFRIAKAMILFGSILKKGVKAGDVDVLFLIRHPKDVEKVDRFCLEISKVRAKPVVPLVMVERDLKTKIKEKDDVVMSILRTGVVLSGDDVVVRCIGG